MKEILSRLCQVPGINGALAVSAEGLLIAAQTGLGDRSAEETAAAVIGNLGRSVSVALERLGRGSFKHLVVSGAGGRAALVASGPGYLVALLAPDANLGLARLELGQAAIETARKMTL